MLSRVRFLYLNKENNYCYLTNKSISELLNISITQVSKLINSLKNKNYISIELIYKENSKQIEMKKLIPIVKNNDTYLTKVKYPLQQNFNTPIEEKFKDNKYNNKNININIIATTKFTKRIRLTLKNEIILAMTLLNYMQMQIY